MKKFFITYKFLGHRKEMNYDGTLTIEASDIFYAKENFYKTKNKDHFFIKSIQEKKDV